MSKALSVDLRERVVAAIEAGSSCQAAASRFGVGISSAIRSASLMGVSPGEAAQVVNDLRSAFERQASAAVKNLGIQDVEGVWAWARTNAPDLLAEAITTQGRSRSTSGYQAIVQAYVAALPSIDADWVMETQHGPGLSLSKTPDGKVVVNVQGRGSFEWSQAVRMGLIRVTGV